MSTESAEPSVAGLSLSGSTAYAPSLPAGTGTGTAAAPETSSHKFTFPSYASFPPFYTLQPNLTTRARQLELWSALITSYCAHHRLFRLSLSSPPTDLFANASIKRSLKQADVRAVLDHMSLPANGSRAEWITPTTRGETSNTCYIYWKTPTEWADQIYSFVEETGQKGAVLTIYELREGESSTGKEWQDIDEALLRKVLNVLVKRGKAQIFGQEESGSSSPHKRRPRQSTIGDAEKPKLKRSKPSGSSSRPQSRSHYEAEASSADELSKIRATLFDAVAGRVGYEGLLLDKGGKPLPPDQVLFSKADAPVRYQENDPYFAHRHQPAEQRLPESDLVKAVHAFTADFYGSGKLDRRPDDYFSFDETALLALGVLLEELGAQSLRRTGDLAFVEEVQRDGLP